MRSEFDELKRFAIADVLSVSGKEKTTSTIEKHIDNIIDVAIAREQHQQSKVDELHKISVALNTETIRQREQVAYYLSKNAELQKRVDAAFRVLSQLNALDDEAHKRWKREACMFSQGESNAYEHAVRLLEQAFKGGSDE